MTAWIEILLMLLILFDLALLGVSRMRTCIMISSLQGMLLGVFTVLAHTQDLTLRIVLIATAAFVLKGFLFPHLLGRSIREASVSLELEPYIGYIPSVIAGLMLLIAAINFINLSTARSAGRAKEVGVRKVLGSVRRDLIGQFLLESFVFSLISLVVAVVLVGLGLPLFNQLAGKQLDAALLATPGMAAAALGLVLAIALLAGSYPAFFISARKCPVPLPASSRLPFFNPAAFSIILLFF